MNASLIPNKDLIDPSFESYKLSLKSTSISDTSECEGIDIKQLQPNNFSRLEIELSSLHNCLFQDRFCPNYLYYVTTERKINVLKLTSRNEKLSKGTTVFCIPPQSAINENQRCNISLKFVRDYVLVFDGSIGLHLLETGDRRLLPLTQWKAAFGQQMNLASPSGYLIDAVQATTVSGDPQVDCIIISVDTSNAKKMCIHLNWFTISQISNQWCVSRHRRLACASFPQYVAFEGSASSLTVCSSQPVVPILDSMNPDVKQPSPDPVLPSESVECFTRPEGVQISWTQSLPSMPQGESCLLNVLLKLSNEQRPINPKAAISVECVPYKTDDDTSSNLKFFKLEVKLQTSEKNAHLCSARLFAPVRPCETMWTYDDETNSVDITLVKDEAGTWPRLFADLGEERRLGVRYDDELATTKSVDSIDEPMQSCFNVEQLEDVDMIEEADDEDATFQHIDGESLEATLRAEMLGQQRLYVALTSAISGIDAPASQLLCTRYDVDGLLWAPQPGNSKHPWTHVATLQAFGYVLASKKNHRFVASPPLDLSKSNPVIPFVAVADFSRHIYVYWQPCPAKDGLTELRKRRSSSTVDSRVVHVAWQQVIALPDSAEEIVGFAAVDSLPSSACVVATREKLYLIHLDDEDL